MRRTLALALLAAAAGATAGELSAKAWARPAIALQRATVASMRRRLDRVEDDLAAADHVSRAVTVEIDGWGYSAELLGPIPTVGSLIRFEDLTWRRVTEVSIDYSPTVVEVKITTYREPTS